jgi:hypothetical protein
VPAQLRLERVALPIVLSSFVFRLLKGTRDAAPRVLGK